ncbi:PREDICTED: E3 ubiquitin-protein ligase RNF144B-like [Ipomoea nil]|uniref:E3 ubiquitin-protein ligase RNF144B-like n=1 Tax=Ipomoea nil TaxID=35883 RepID=UPI0009014F34|nr:PREDICTED: E3 ubiquitin-protein ligase RNF144B-like [Ipomoea nil]
MASDSDPYVDDFYFSALYDEDEIFPISDEKYAEELQLQEALMSCAAKTQTPGRQAEAGESSQAFCEICMDTKTGDEMFRIDSCRHSYCSECIGGHVAAKIQENVSAVKCLDVSCKGIIEPQHCRSIIPTEVLERWETALCESLILASQKFYCPYKDCSAMMVDDGSETVTVSECPTCRRLFCAQCKVAWHAGIDCREFQLLNEDERGREDVMLMELAKDKQWRRCPCCRFYVEKNAGCLHISCRCGQEFCYGCGAKYSSDHVCPRP